MLTHRNVGANVEGFATALGLRSNDVLVGVLPFFHALGYTATLWAPLVLEKLVVYHYNPLEAHRVGDLVRRNAATILLATPTLLRLYTKRCPKGDFASLQLVFVGAERLSPAIATAFRNKFGIEPCEGYGVTKLSPVVSANAPVDRGPNAAAQGFRAGTVGRPLPGVLVTVVDLQSGEDLGKDRPGLLLVKGPSVMKGYLGDPARTAEVMHDGWYVTGNIAVADADGFLRLVDRLGRFSKIGGEMVPHIRVEEAIRGVLGPEGERAQLIVTAVPDENKGERLIVLHTGLSQSPETISRQLGQQGTPAL
jgi:acyl-[acyl-carrier-protein]-phospholipid O-acyltransferase/long-chain-fatty-acid--[acyl-carrier-protein] ligase